MNSRVFVLDTSVFIQAKNSYLAFDLAPGFWDVLVDRAQGGRLLSVDRVLDELEKGKDALADWAGSDFAAWFISTDEAGTIACYQRIMTWVNGHGDYSDAAKADFARGADGWLIAYCLVNANTLVTQEALRPGIQRKVPIPNVCEHFNVLWVDTFQMMRQLAIRWLR